jgi:hypothetical protein
MAPLGVRAVAHTKDADKTIERISIESTTVASWLLKSAAQGYRDAHDVLDGLAGSPQQL